MKHLESLILKIEPQVISGGYKSAKITPAQLQAAIKDYRQAREIIGKLRDAFAIHAGTHGPDYEDDNKAELALVKAATKFLGS